METSITRHPIPSGAKVRIVWEEDEKIYELDATAHGELVIRSEVEYYPFGSHEVFPKVETYTSISLDIEPRDGVQYRLKTTKVGEV